MSSSVTLSAATRQNLLSLQDTSALTSTTQNRLSTGKKVSSALDNPTNFFTSQALNSRSSDLSGLLDGLSNSVQTIQAANQGITSIQKLVDQAKSITSQALASKNTTTEGVGTSAVAAATNTTLKIKVDGIEKSVAIKTHVDAVEGKDAVVASDGPDGVAGNADDVAAAPAVTAVKESGDTIQGIVDKLNSAVGNKVFSLDSGGKLVANGAGKVEITDSATATALGLEAPADASTSTTSLKSEDKTRTSLANQYNALLTQIDQLAKDASYNGVNLISSADKDNKLHIAFNESDTSSLDVAGVDLTTGTKGLNISAISVDDATKAFQSDDDVKSAVTQLTSASSNLRAQASTFGSNLSVVQNRQDFSKQIINILGTGASNLTDADLNEEAANSQALTTRQSLGISALSLANQAQQGILQLLR